MAAYKSLGGASPAAASSGGGDDGRIVLVGKVDRNDDRVNSAVIVSKEDGLIAISHDRTVKAWIKRYSGEYWPSISQSLPAVPVCMDYNLTSRLLLIGLENGFVMEFQVADDYNKMIHIRDYIGKQKKSTYKKLAKGAVVGVMSVAEYKWILSCGSDLRFVCSSSETGHPVVVYQISSTCSCLQYDVTSSYLFLGDSSGQILVLKLSVDGEKPQRITALKRHTDSVQRMILDKQRRLLYSASLDKSIAVWDIKNTEFPSITLNGHSDRVRSICLCSTSNHLLSVGDDETLVCWDMNGNRKTMATWHESDVCEICQSPFYWNVRTMWENKTLGVRQHHCRHCGKALCAKCAGNNDVIPVMGFECPVRTCDECHQLLENERQPSQASIHSLYHSAVYVDVDAVKKIILTVGKDKVIKLWDASSLLK